MSQKPVIDCICGHILSICYHQFLIIYSFDEAAVGKNNSIDNRSLVLAVSSFFFVLLSFAFFIFFWIRPFIAQKDGMVLAGQYGDSFGALNCIFSGLGFSVIIVTLIFQQGQIKRQVNRENSEVEERRSLFNLDAWEDANRKAKVLLGDGNNDRATWIRAARVIEHANILAKGVSVENHQRVMELKSLEYRSFFRTLIQSKSASFFYGTDDSSVTTEEAAKASTVAVQKNGRHIFGNSILSESSIFSIVRAAEWPKDYIDPIDEIFPENFESASFLYDGLKDFLYHTREWSSFDGELKKRRRSDLN